MPSGLDGNPTPIVTPARDRVLGAVVESILGLEQQRILIAVDGRSGAGKSTFADELAVQLVAVGRQVVRSTTDSFHRPRSERMRLGTTSADGYFLESHQLDIIRGSLLEPFAAGEATVLVAAFDEPSNSAVLERSVVEGPAILVFDGLFLQRPEFEDLWTMSIYLEADDRADRGWLDFLLGDLPDDVTARAATIDERLERARWPRYRAGWHDYFVAMQPSERATVVIDNNDISAPRLIRR